MTAIPDKTLCTNNECWIRHDCLRYTSEPQKGYRYAYFVPRRVLGATLDCKHKIQETNNG